MFKFTWFCYNLTADNMANTDSIWSMSQRLQNRNSANPEQYLRVPLFFYDQHLQKIYLMVIWWLHCNTNRLNGYDRKRQNKIINSCISNYNVELVFMPLPCHNLSFRSNTSWVVHCVRGDSDARDFRGSGIIGDFLSSKRILARGNWHEKCGNESVWKYIIIIII
jgi:hypothetical protein